MPQYLQLSSPDPRAVPLCSSGWESATGSSVAPQPRGCSSPASRGLGFRVKGLEPIGSAGSGSCLQRRLH